MKIFYILLSILVSVNSYAAEKATKTAPEKISEKSAAKAMVLSSVKVDKVSPIKFAFPYTLGTHEGIVKRLNGNLTVTGGDFETASGTFEFNIKDIDTDDAEMNCHLQESLGLNYEASDFPEDHVCEDDKLPENGKNAIVYPRVSMIWNSAKFSEDKKKITVNASWTFHNRKLDMPIELDVVKLADNEIHLKGKKWFTIKDFAVKVKSFLFISVGKQVKIIFDVTLKN